MPVSYEDDDSGLIPGARDLPPWLVAGYVRREAEKRGATGAEICLQDFGQQVLIPLSDDGTELSGHTPHPIDGSLAGRAYSSMSPVEADDPSGVRLYLPLCDGGDRVGVLVVSTPALDDPGRVGWQEFAADVAALIVTKSRQSDVFFRARRTHDMIVAAEMQWRLLPPLGISEPRVEVAGLIEPAYHVGGDAFDYAINHETAHFAVFDAMGHGLDAAVMSGVAVAAYRHARRATNAIADTYTVMDSVFAPRFGGDKFVTAQLADLHLPSGTLTMVNAGHPTALHVRGRKVIGTIDGPRTMPVGLGGARPEVVTVALEPGDRILLYTDGVTEARHGREAYGDERLAADLELALADSVPVPEIIRRLNRRQAEWRGREPDDDCTLVMVEWLSRILSPLRPQP